jgi:hypothetical protein
MEVGRALKNSKESNKPSLCFSSTPARSKAGQAQFEKRI